MLATTYILKFLPCASVRSLAQMFLYPIRYLQTAVGAPSHFPFSRWNSPALTACLCAPYAAVPKQIDGLHRLLMELMSRSQPLVGLGVAEDLE